MSSILEVAEAIVAREGGFVDDPDDPGGATQYGVSLATLRGLGIDLTGDGEITVADVRKVTRREAAELAPEHLCDAYAIAWRNFYYRLGDARVTSRKYVRRNDGGKGGWIARAESFMSAQYRLSDEEHTRRVAQWD